MNVLLIQPPEPPQSAVPVYLARQAPPPFAPPWNLLCLRAYIRQHTRHNAELVDCRLLNDVGPDLIKAVEAVEAPKLLVVNAVSHALGQTAAILNMAKRAFPDITVVLSGDFPSLFSGHVTAIPGVDYGLAGDPEPILRNLLDYMDVPQRLQLIPGLIRNDGHKPYWLKSLTGLSLPEWDGLVWSAYKSSRPPYRITAEARLSRGHTRLPADRAFGNAHEPLRFWPMDRLAGAIQRCAHLEVTEVVLSDPPGIWTPQRLNNWCQALQSIRNTQPWAMYMLPTTLSEQEADDLNYAACRRIEFIFPSCDPDNLKRYGCIVDTHDLIATIEMLESYEISVTAQFWLGGPEEQRAEANGVIKLIRELGFLQTSLHPFPLNLQAPLYEEMSQTSTTPHLNDWIKWSRDPWIMERPIPLWSGAAGLEHYQKACISIQRAVAHSPRRLIKRLAHRIRTTNWIRAIEDKAVGTILKPVSPE